MPALLHLQTVQAFGAQRVNWFQIALIGWLVGFGCGLYCDYLREYRRDSQ